MSNEKYILEGIDWSDTGSHSYLKYMQRELNQEAFDNMVSLCKKITKLKVIVDLNLEDDIARSLDSEPLTTKVVSIQNA